MAPRVRGRIKTPVAAADSAAGGTWMGPQASTVVSRLQLCREYESHRGPSDDDILEEDLTFNPVDGSWTLWLAACPPTRLPACTSLSDFLPTACSSQGSISTLASRTRYSLISCWHVTFSNVSKLLPV